MPLNFLFWNIKYGSLNITQTSPDVIYLQSCNFCHFQLWWFPEWQPTFPGRSPFLQLTFVAKDQLALWTVYRDLFLNNLIKHLPSSALEHHVAWQSNSQWIMMQNCMFSFFSSCPCTAEIVQHVLHHRFLCPRQAWGAVLSVKHFFFFMILPAKY